MINEKLRINNTKVNPIIINEFNTIDLNESTWVLNHPRGLKVNTKITMTMANKEFEELLKDYCYCRLVEYNPLRYETLNGYVKKVKDFLRYLSNNGINKTNEIYRYTIKEYFQDLEIQEKTASYLNEVRNVLINFFDYLSKYNLSYKNYVKMIKEIKYNRNGEITPYKLIPINYFNSLISLLRRIVIGRESVNEEERKFAAILLIETQLGLRISELVNLDVNCLKDGFVVYKSYKGAKRDAGYIDVVTPANEFTIDAIYYLIEKCQKERTESKTDLLYLPKDYEKYLKDKTNYLRKCMVQLSINHTDALDNVNNELYNRNLASKVVGALKSKYFIKNDGFNFNSRQLENTDVICFPLFHQFRVYRINYYINKGVRLDLIKKTVGHLTEAETYAYGRPTETKEQIEEKIKFGKIPLPKVDELARMLASQKGFKSLDEMLETDNPIRLKKYGYCSANEFFDCPYERSSDEEVFENKLNDLNMDDYAKVESHNRECGFEEIIPYEKLKIKEDKG